MQLRAEQIKRFDFDNLVDFAAPKKQEPVVTEAPEQLVVEELPPPPPTFSEEELEKAKKEAFEAGKKEGIQEEIKRRDTEEARRNQAIETSCQKLLTEASNLIARHQHYIQSQSFALAPIVLETAKRVAGDAVQQTPESGITEMLTACLDMLQHLPEITLLVHDSLAEVMQNKADEVRLKHQLACAISVKSHPSIALGDAQLQWQDGTANRNLETLWQQIEQLIASQDFAGLTKELIDAPFTPPAPALQEASAAVPEEVMEPAPAPEATVEAEATTDAVTDITPEEVRADEAPSEEQATEQTEDTKGE